MRICSHRLMLATLRPSLPALRAFDQQVVFRLVSSDGGPHVLSVPKSFKSSVLRTKAGLILRVHTAFVVRYVSHIPLFPPVVSHYRRTGCHLAGQFVSSDVMQCTLSITGRARGRVSGELLARRQACTAATAACTSVGTLSLSPPGIGIAPCCRCCTPCEYS